MQKRMKRNVIKKLFVCTFLASVSLSTFAEGDDNYLFNHLGATVGVGTPGVTVELATTCTKYVGVRAGVNIFPTISPTITFNTSGYYDAPPELIGRYEVPEDVDVKGKLKLTTGHLLFDVYPFPSVGFRVTVGAYFGGSEVATLRNKEDGLLMDVTNLNKEIDQINTQTGQNYQKVGVTLGDYLLTSDENGNVNGAIKVKGFRPYVGIGWGRAVPKHRVGFSFDLGVQFWGTPEVYCQDHKLSKEDVGDEDGGEIMKVISKVTVYPVLSFRLSTRIL